jgi:hypothetical protein
MSPNPLNDLAAAAKSQPPTSPTRMPASVLAGRKPTSTPGNRLQIHDGFMFGIGFWLSGVVVSLVAWMLIAILAGLGIASCSMFAPKAASPPPPFGIYRR